MMMWTAAAHHHHHHHHAILPPALPLLLDPSSFCCSSSLHCCDPFSTRRRRRRSSNKQLFISHGGRISCQAKDGQTASYIQELSTRSSVMEVRKEILLCYGLIQKLGKGVVYLGSSRTKQDHPHFLQAVDLGRKVATLLDCTTWTGVGSGLMDAVVKGALQSGKPVGGFKIAREAGEWTSSSTHPYLDKNVYVTCRFFSARKHGLVDAAVRDHSHEKTAFVALPGGIGTVDEIFEILTLIQLGRLGSKYPVPFLLINYDGFYTKLLEFLTTCKAWGSVAEGEVEKLWTVCENNEEALEHLSAFYGIQNPDIKNA